MYRQRLLVGFLMLVVGVLAASGRSEAQVPQPIRYHGQALNAQGVPLEGTHTLVFRLYDAETGGQKMWEETQPNIPLSDGEFTVLLGQTTSLASLNWIARPLWFAIQVDNDAERSPRQRIAGAPVPLSADEVDQSGAQNLLSNGSLESWSKGTTVAPDGWTLEGGGRPTVTKNTTSVQRELASATVTNTAGNPGYLKQTVRTISSTTNTQLRGATVTLSCWVKTSNASLVQLIINEGPRLTRSAYHSGSGSYELLSVTTTLQNDATELTAYLFIDGGPSGTATFDGATLVQGPAALALNVQPLPPVQFRQQICTDCQAEMELAGQPTNPQRLVHVAYDHLSLSTNGGRTWTSRLLKELTNDAYEDSGIDAKVVALDNGSFFIATTASLVAKQDKLGGVLYRGDWSGALTTSVFQDIPANDSHDESFPFVSNSQLAVDPATPSVYILGETWFPDTASYALALYVSHNNGATFTRTRLTTAHLTTASGLLLGEASSFALAPDGTLYGAYVYAPLPSTSAEVKASLMRFRATDPVVFDEFPLPGLSHPVSPKRSASSTKGWDVHQGPILLVDAGASSAHRGRLYMVWAQEERVVADPAFEPGVPGGGAYGFNYDIFASFSDNRGASWSAPAKVTDDAGSANQVYPSAQLDANGILHVAWLDQRFHPAKERVDAFYASSTDGAHFTKNLQVNDQSIPMFRQVSSSSGTPEEEEVFGSYLDMVQAYPDHVDIATPCGPDGRHACLTEVATIGNRPPTLSGLANQTVQAGHTLSFDVSATDSDTPAANLVFSYSPTLGGASFAPTGSPGVWRFTWSPSTSQTVSVTFKVTDDPSDASGQRTASQTITITVNPAQPLPPPPSFFPEVKLIKPAGPFPLTVAPGEKVDLEAQVVFSTVFTVEFSQNGAPAFAVDKDGAPYTATWIAPETEGLYTLTARGSGPTGVGNPSAPVTITVVNVNRPPAIISNPLQGYFVNGGDTLSVPVEALDPDHTPLSYHFRFCRPNAVTTRAVCRDSAEGADFDPVRHLFRWTPVRSQTGLNTVTVTVSDGELQATQDLSVLVIFPNRPPVLNGTVTQTARYTPTPVTAPLPASFQQGAVDPDGDPLEFFWDFGDGTAQVSGQQVSHTYAAPGVYTYTVTVSDGIDLVSQRHQIDIVIPEVIPPPQIIDSVAPGRNPRRLLP